MKLEWFDNCYRIGKLFNFLNYGTMILKNYVTENPYPNIYFIVILNYDC